MSIVPDYLQQLKEGIPIIKQVGKAKTLVI